MTAGGSTVADRQPVAEASQSAVRTAMAGLIGNVLEWFDFAVYGYFASDIGRQFFPQSSPAAQQLLALRRVRARDSAPGRSAASCSAWSATASADARC